jgi:hypothetical protein
MRKGYMERFQLTAALFAIIVGIAFALAQGTNSASAKFTSGQDKSAPSTQKDTVCEYLGQGPTPATAGEIKTGILGCKSCHTGPSKGEAAGFVNKFKSNEFVLLNEAETWVQDDIHSQATKCLTDPRGQQMEKALKYKVAEDARCLTCHSADTAPTKPLHEKVYADFATNEGAINCTVCHGLYKNWQNDHYDEPRQKGAPLPWRSKPPAEKWSKGMADLRNPVVKARLCVSCHIGNPDEGKVVTHDMYAAGHPPLPPFELASFMQSEPKHWAFPTDERMKFFDTVDPKVRWNLFHSHPAKDESYLSRHYAVGAITALRAEAALLFADASADLEAQKAIKNGNTKVEANGIDFARFDCYTCHHDLKLPSDRQARGYDGLPPGRPTLRAASSIPAGIVAKHGEGIDTGGLKAKAAGFTEAWNALRKAATDRPFGDVAKVRDTAKAVMDWCDGFLKVQCDTIEPIYSREQANRLQTMIAQQVASPKVVADPEAVLGLSWGYIALKRETDPKFLTGAKSKLSEIIPLSVREAPYSENGEPVPAQYKPRMNKFNEFKSKDFTEAFRSLAGGGPQPGGGG